MGTHGVSPFTAGSIQPGDMYRDTHGTPLCRTMRALSAIILIPMSGVGSWKMTSWLLRVILRMRMSTRAVSRVQRHCRASLPQGLQIERLLTVPWNAIVTRRIIIFTGISYFVRPVLYAWRLFGCMLDSAHYVSNWIKFTIEFKLLLVHKHQ